MCLLECKKVMQRRCPEDEAKFVANAFAPFTGRTSAVYLDSVTGQPLDSALVDKARELELEYFKNREVW